MARKDVSDAMIVQAAIDFHNDPSLPITGRLLMERTGQCARVVERAMERAIGRGLIEDGTTIFGAWATDKGRRFLVIKFLESPKIDPSPLDTATKIMRSAEITPS